MRSVSILTLAVTLAIAGLAHGAKPEPSAYQAAVHLSGKIGSRPSGGS